MSLQSVLKDKVIQWRKNDYKSNFGSIAEILKFNFLSYVDEENYELRYLRKAQFEALETYWYLRLVENTPHIFDLYNNLFPNPLELLKSLNIPTDDEKILNLSFQGGIARIFDEIKSNDDFVKEYKLQVVRESLLLEYPSYILALAMGVGKTVLIGTIIATEFSMSFDNPDEDFVKNALVFAPGKTILGALKELSDIPFEKILPKRLYKIFMSTVKYKYTKDGEKDIPIINNSNYNIIVTNTEKIRITKNKITQTLLKSFSYDKKNVDIVKEAVANQRLRSITSMNNLAVFSDEAHHLYGNKMDRELKRVRETVNYISNNTNLKVVINTTGTPYYQKEMLKDVIFWYGLSEGIRDGILKDVNNNIVGYEDVNDEEFLTDVLSDFLNHYSNVALPNGARSKIAFYFPQIDDLRDSRKIIERVLIDLGYDTSLILEVHSESAEEIRDLFDNRINDPRLPYRIFLLVNKGTEGWNCLSLFATALARELRSSNNFCLQAATRCLRQVSGNKEKAKIYLSQKNVSILNSQIKDAYGETLQIINRTSTKNIRDRIYIEKEEIEPLSILISERKVIPLKNTKKLDDIDIVKPVIDDSLRKKIIYDIRTTPGRDGVLAQTDSINLERIENVLDLYSVCLEIKQLYDLDYFSMYNKLKKIYKDNEIPESEYIDIKKQVEKQLNRYDIVEEKIIKDIAIIKREGFNKEEVNSEIKYYAEIVYNISNSDHILKKYEVDKINNKDMGFHYNPYNFDSGAEKDFFISMLSKINIDLDEVSDIYFTGGINDPAKTDYLFDYLGKDNRWHKYNPDFLIRLKNDKYLIVEIKDARMKNDEIDGLNGLKAAAIRKIENINPDKVKYEIIFADSSDINISEIKRIENKVREMYE